ncbi:hypothetical protein B9Z55_028856 [Caenorhabditis nigoni]|uniref:Uncharacterized protein n=1 Tax=Caenorhabditis nigoni TaxID=1611254 RepID=A0A2G5S9N8_9PELO|nr:hypothetical protein B9Z55_028856 [Caenorhabditis nigoni]
MRAYSLQNRSPGFGDNRNPSPSPLATRQVTEAALAEKPKVFQKKTTMVNFSIGWSSAGDKEGERQRKDVVQRSRRQNS